MQTDFILGLLVILGIALSSVSLLALFCMIFD